MRIADTPRNVSRAKVPAWRANLDAARNDLFELAGRALDSGEEGLGAELTYEGLSSTVWRDLHLATMVAGLFERISMPTTPFRIPFEFGDLTWYRGSSNVGGPDHQRRDPAGDAGGGDDQDTAQLVVRARRGGGHRRPA